MKTLLLLFCFAFLGMKLAFAQKDNPTIIPDGINKNLQSQPKIDFRSHIFLSSIDTVRQDSIEVDFPENLLLDRELDLSNLKSLKPNEAALPFFELPPSRSRMPILTFDKSVNYTILKKEFK